MFQITLSILILFLSSHVHASFSDAERLYETRGNRFQIAKELIEGGYHFTATPMIKETVFRQLAGGEDTAKTVENLIYQVGLKQFEPLPEQTLLSLDSPAVNFILAKKYFRKKEYKKALKQIQRINSDNFFYPVAKFVEGSIYTIDKKLKPALNSYKLCISSSVSSISDARTESRKFQLEFNRDNCIVGKARTLFALKKYDQANLAYLDLPKRSFIWPEVLFEEAWNSFYRKNYNRTLGKLITYRSPLLSYIYNPNVSVLQALTYYEMCLYEDAKREIESFYDGNMQPARRMRLILRRLGKDYRKYFNLALLRTKKKTGYGGLFDKTLKAVTKEPTYQELINYFKKAMDEYRQVKTKPNSRFKRFVTSNLAEALRLQRDITGAYVRSRMLEKYTKLYQAFQEMSYIKLEILQKKKFKLYKREVVGSNKRGDVKYIKRNEKQYFWDFNHEFWADELGDYVFALKSEC